MAIYKDFKEISSDNVTTILESPATDSPFSVLQNFPFAGRTISRSNPGYACSQSPVKAQRRSYDKLVINGIMTSKFL